MEILTPFIKAHKSFNRKMIGKFQIVRLMQVFCTRIDSRRSAPKYRKAQQNLSDNFLHLYQQIAAFRQMRFEPARHCIHCVRRTADVLIQ